MRLLAIVLLSIVIIGLPNTAHPREWVSATGNHRVEAEFVAASQDSVQLRKSDGKVVTVRLASLSVADRRFVQEEVRATTSRLVELERQLVASRNQTLQLTTRVRQLEQLLAEKVAENQHLSGLLQQMPQQVVAVPQAPLIGAGPPIGGVYAAVGGGHWVKSKSSDGAVVVLEDGSTWQIETLYRLDTRLWLNTDPVAVIDNTTGITPYRLVNESSGDVVEARLLSR